MNSKAISFLNNFSYTISSNLIALLISTLVTLVVPKLIGIEEYGYWQLYLFYSSYVGFLHFGWNDGMYLKYGGKEYDQLNSQVFFSQFYMLTLFQLILLIVIIVVTFIMDLNNEKNFIIQMTAICMVIMNVRGMLIYIFQGTNKIKEYARVTMIDRLIYCLLIILFLTFGIREYKVMIIADLLGKCFSLVFAMYWGRNLVYNKISTFQFDFVETIDNVKIGIKLMFANIASMLIIGAVRMGIEYSWDVSTFGKVSLTLSVSNLMMLFINAVGLIMFPILRRTNKSKLADIYITMKDFLMIILLGVLIIYYPLKVILSDWLPNYSDSLIYMALVFPMSLYEGKMALLINTYLKTLREEKAMLQINLISLILSLLLTYITTILLGNLNLAILSIVLVLAFRCCLAEIYLAKILNISIFKDLGLELIMTFIFIITAWFGETWMSIVFYIVAYVIYLFIKKNDINKMIINLKQLLTN